MTKTHRIGAGVLLAAPLLAMITNLVLPTISDDASPRVTALTTHHSAMVTGMTLEVLSIALMIGGVLWLADTLRRHAPRLALAGGILGALGGLVVLFEDGLAAAAPPVVNALSTAQATTVLDGIHSSAAGRVVPLSLLQDVGLVLLGVAAVKAGAPTWLGVAVGLSAVMEAAGLATGTRALAVIGFAALLVSLAGVVRGLAGARPLPVAQPAMSAA